jgi:ABC-2 type transport system permease protein
MNAYLLTSRLALMDRLSYRGETLMGLAASGARVVMALVLWRAILGESGSVSGYSLPMAMTHYLFAALLPAIDQSDLYVREFAAEIRSGDFGKYLARPVDPLLHFLSVSMGRSAFQAAAALTAFCAAIGLDAAFSGGFFSPLDPLGLLLSLPVALSGLLCMALLNYLTALLAFRFQDITPWHMVKENVVEILSGAVLPLAILPAWASGLISLTPFPALTDLPAALALGMGRERLPGAVAVLLSWTAGLSLLAVLSGKRAVRGYAGAGG